MILRLDLLADNSSGEQTLHIDCGEDGLHLTLTGEYRDEDIQIDFNPPG